MIDTKRWGVLCLDGWAGRTTQIVEIVRETPKRYRVRAITPLLLPGHRTIARDEETLVPKRAVSLLTN